MSHVILATDGSRGAAIAETLLGAIPWPAGTAVHVATVVPRLALIGPSSLRAGRPMGPDQLAEQQARAAALASATAARVAAGLPELAVDWVVLRGGAAAAIERLAAEVEADLIVVGSQGQTAIDGRTLGSVAASIADDATCPVLVARGPALGRTLVADDGSTGAAEAVRYLRERTWLLGSVARFAVVVPIERSCSEAFDLAIEPVAVCRLDALRAESFSAAEARLASDLDAIRTAGCDASLEIATEEGMPGAALVAAATAWHADLGVVGSRAQPGKQRLHFGSVGRHVVHNAPCSVLLVPQMSPGRQHVLEQPLALPVAVS